MWPFGKGARQKAHQDLVSLAQEILKKFPPPSACTGRSRAPIPGQGEHPFRSKVSTDSGDAERAFRAR